MWGPHALKGEYCQEYSMKYIYSTSQMSKLSLTLHTFSITGLVAGLFLIMLVSLQFWKTYIFSGSASLKVFLIELLLHSSFTFSINIFATFQLFCNFLKKVSSFSNSVFIVRFSFYRCHPNLSSNSIYSVAECFLLLYWNSTTNNHSI